MSSRWPRFAAASISTFCCLTQRGKVPVSSHQPRMTCVDFAALPDATVAGLGVVLLPDHACRDELDDGKLVHVFPQWTTPVGIIHLVFTTRRGLPPAVRSFIDHLASTFSGGTSQ
jgi:DNA-binding transcriptional LysR family regulator